MMDLDAFNAQVKKETAETKKIFINLKKRKAKVLDQQFADAHEKAFKKIDCLTCANCCKTAGPRLLQKDIDRIAKHFKIKAGVFMDRYVKVDEDGDWVMNSLPCPFLGADNFCGIYEVRPRACQAYPHTDRSKMHQILKLTEKNASLCPAVFDISRMLSKE
jgi:Fe-S-cluster containining protein